MSLLMAPWLWVRLCMLIGAAMASWPVSGGADTGHVVVVIVPSFRPASPPPQRFRAQAPLQWAPPPAMGLTPGQRSPAAIGRASPAAVVRACHVASTAGAAEAGNTIGKSGRPTKLQSQRSGLFTIANEVTPVD
jgi:hypothetical protein